MNANENAPAFQVKGKVVTIGEVQKDKQSDFFEIEKRKYDLVDQAAKDAYLDSYWSEKAKAAKKSVEATRDEYFAKNLKINDSEIKSTLAQFKDHPQLAKLPPAEQNTQIRNYLEERNKRQLIEDIISAGISKKELVVMYPRPQEPVFDVKVVDTDHVRYRAKGDYAKPVSCKGDDCAITIIEYSEFQCPFCQRVLGDVKKVMETYEGKIRWIVRDFPLSFHDRARPAAIAAKCAAKQEKYWEMYTALFDNQKSLSDGDFEKYAKDIGLNMDKYKKCYKSPNEIEKVIDANLDSGSKLGVTGTPAFLINGRKLSGALPFSEFKQVIDDELTKSKKRT